MPGEDFFIRKMNNNISQIISTDSSVGTSATNISPVPMVVQFLPFFEPPTLKEREIFSNDKIWRRIVPIPFGDRSGEKYKNDNIR